MSCPGGVSLVVWKMNVPSQCQGLGHVCSTRYSFLSNQTGGKTLCSSATTPYPSFPFPVPLHPTHIPRRYLELLDPDILSKLILSPLPKTSFPHSSPTSTSPFPFLCPSLCPLHWAPKEPSANLLYDLSCTSLILPIELYDSPKNYLYVSQGKGPASSLGSSVPAALPAPSRCSINTCCVNSRLYLKVLLPLKPLCVFRREHPAPASPGPVHILGYFTLEGGEDFSALFISIKENLSGKSQPQPTCLYTFYMPRLVRPQVSWREPHPLTFVPCLLASGAAPSLDSYFRSCCCSLCAPCAHNLLCLPESSSLLASDALYQAIWCLYC